jgi:hypothetical protein
MAERSIGRRFHRSHCCHLRHRCQAAERNVWFNCRRTGPRVAAALLWLALVGCSAAAFSQEPRYELGGQLRMLESELQTPLGDLEIRQRLLPHLERAVQRFFQLQLAEASAELDRALVQLRHGEAAAWPLSAAAVRIRLRQRWLDVTADRLQLRWGWAYGDGDLDWLSGIDWQWELLREETSSGGAGQTPGRKPAGAARYRGTVSLADLPAGEWFDLPLERPLLAGQWRLGGELVERREAERRWRLPWQTVAVSDRLGERLEAVRRGAREVLDRQTPGASLRMWVQLLSDLARGRTLETDYPADRLLEQAEAVVQASLPHPWLQPGHHWLQLQADRRGIPVRVVVPDNPRPTAGWPLVIAAHGAGGSENMFADAYGAGRIVQLARQRGWLLVCPRLGLMGGSVSLDELLALVDQQWPIDRRQVMLIGHSMGAGQCINWIDRAESNVLAAAIIGGGRAPAAPAKWRETQVLAAAGEQDFGRPGVEAFAAELRRGGHPQVQLELYPAIEHLVIVQAALDDVFASWDPLVRALVGESID